MNIYKSFEAWKNGNWLEDGEPRKEAYTQDELDLVEMGWKYGFDAGMSFAKTATENYVNMYFESQLQKAMTESLQDQLKKASEK
jgi:hypothetical protein